VSWDVLILHPESAAAAPDGDPRLRPLGMADEVRRAVSRALPGIEWDAPVQGSYRGTAVDVDVELPSQGVVDSFALHLRGAANPMPFILRICRQNGWVAFDSVAGSFLDLQNPAAQGWESGLLFRAQIQALSQLHREKPASGRLGRRHLLALVPLLLTLHNLEEALFMPGFLERFADRAGRLPSFLAGLLPDVTLAQFLIALALVTVAPYLFAASGPLERRGRAFYLVLGTQMVVLLNVAVHVAGAVWMRGYVPGLVTALLVNLPFSVYLFRRALRGGWLRWREMAWLVLAALLVHGPGLVGLLVLAGWAAGGY
jgi:hypothetical protein